MTFDPLMQEATRLHDSGKIADAGRLYEQILRGNPRHPGALAQLGFLHLQQNHLDDAVTLLSAAISADATAFEPWYHLASALYRQGRNEEALNCIDGALAIDPAYVEALSNRGAILMAVNSPDRALATLDTALAFRPDFPSALINRGNVLAALGRHEEALEIFEAALQRDPDNPDLQQRRETALFELGRATRCPPDYMRRLFDKYSERYDQHMTGTLRYRGHEHLRTLFDRVRPDAAGPLAIVDLGSGTGLVGEEFKELAAGGRLDGIDLAPLMIEAARKRGIYTDLILGDLETVLPAPGPSYDLALAADTMIYIGDLAPTFAGVARRLVPGGHYVFAVEAKDDGTWEKTETSRFRHSLDYIRAEAKRAGLAFVDSMDCVLRYENREPIKGFAVALQKPPAQADAA